MPRKKTLPKYVVVRKVKTPDGKLEKQWFVRRAFPTPRRDKRNKIIYDPYERRCFPETEERAKEVVLQIETEYESILGQNGSGAQTVNDLLGQWKSAKQSFVEERTFEDYNELHDRYVRRSIGNILLSELKPLDVQMLYNSLKEKGLHPLVIRKIHIFLHSALSQGVKWKVLAEDPTDAVIKPQVIESESLAMSLSEAKAFLEIARKDFEYFVFEFALETGLRTQEFLALDWDSIDVGARTVRVARAVQFRRKGGGYKFKDTKSKHSRRTLSISEHLTQRLVDYKEYQKESLGILKKRIAELKRKPRAKFAPKGAKNNGANVKKRALMLRNAEERLKNLEKLNLVFPSKEGLPRSPNNLARRDFKKVLEAAGIDPRKFSPYSLRHTNASILADKLHPKRLQKWLGHASITTSLKYYVHVDDESRFAASDAFSQTFYEK